MKNIIQQLILLLLVLAGGFGWSQNSPNCITKSDDDYYTDTVFINSGSATNAFNPSNRVSTSVGLIATGNAYSEDFTALFGFWNRFLLPPLAPAVQATQGDLYDRIQVSWTPDPLSPEAKEGFNIYRNGALLAHVNEDVRTLIDFNVLAGQFYTYEVSGVNKYGEGNKGSTLGFLNPNGVVTGQVKTFSGNPVPGCAVSLSPTLGKSLAFDGDDFAFAEPDSAWLTPHFTVSCWVKLDDGNNYGGILSRNGLNAQNWWLTTNPSSASKGIIFSIGDGSLPTNIGQNFPSATANDWHHIAATFNGINLLLYLDGELVGTATGLMTTNAQPLVFGKSAVSASNVFKGKLDEVRIYDRQLTQTEIMATMNKTVPSDADGLVAYWKFDEGAGTKAFDITTNRSKAYFCGAAWSDDKPQVVNTGVTDETGFYEIEAVNYGTGQTFTATPSKKFYSNQSLEFNGVNETYADLTDFDLPDTSTITLTIKTYDFTGSPVILSKNGNGAPGDLSGFILYLDNGNLKLSIASQTHDYGPLGMGFHHLALKMKQDSGSLETTLYKNGADLGSHTYSNVPPAWSGQPWKIGALLTTGFNHSGFFTGLIDEVAFFDSLLTVGAIQTFANTGTNEGHVALVHYFNLNEGSGDEIADMGTEPVGHGTVHGATWSIVAKTSQSTPHEFQPSNRLLTLNPSNTSTDQIDFTDLSTVPVSGFVRFDGTNCFQDSVEILVNGKSHTPQIFTDEDGKFVADFEPGMDVVLKPKFVDHSFYPMFWELVNLSTPVAGILFKNQTNRTIEVHLAGGNCRKSIIPSTGVVEVRIKTLDECFKEDITIDADGMVVIDNLPPTKFTVAVSNHPLLLDYFQLQGGVTVDLSTIEDTLVEFIYIAPPQIELNTDADTAVACGIVTMTQFQPYQTEVKVFEDYFGEKCYLDSAVLTINNDIADLSEFDTVMRNGSFKHKYNPGYANIISPYLKTFSVVAEVDGRLANATQSLVVLGKRQRQTTFVSASPEFPDLILRDPPGDGSYAFIEEGVTTCENWTFEGSDAFNNAESLVVSYGPDLTMGFGLGVEVHYTIDVTADLGYQHTGSAVHLESSSVETCLTTTEVISTSENDLVVGSGMGGDLYMGGARNFIFGIMDILLLDTNVCEFGLDTGLIISPQGYATTFIYSEYQITNDVIPNLLTIGDTTSAMRWQAIIDQNMMLKNQATFDKNLSFDAGIVYEQSQTTEVTTVNHRTWTQEFDNGFSVALGLTVSGVGAVGNMNFSWSESETFDTAFTNATTRTAGFKLSDDDIGDNFSVDILKDKVYGTPVFKLKSGRSSCPWEPGTQNREGVHLAVDNPSAVNVPYNEAAVFNFTIGNVSGSGEQWSYLFAMGPESNVNGAIVKANGAPLTVPVLYEVAHNEGLNVVVTVERGPTEYAYEDIEIAWYSKCEDARATALGFSPDTLCEPKFPVPNVCFYDQIFIDVYFQEPCSPVDIGFPLQDWVHLPADDDTIFITLNSYDVFDADLELIRVQYRRTQGDGAWINIAEIDKADLGTLFEIVEWNTTDLSDGLYEIRAVTQCDPVSLAPGISHVIKGKIERTPPEIFGTPQPADGVLSPGDEISITFNEPIRCDLLLQADNTQNNNLGLHNTRTGDLVDIEFSCSGDKIIITPNVQLSFIENDVLRMDVDSVYDLAGNAFDHADWEFFVDRNPLRWQINDLVEFKYEDEFKTVYRAIVNTGGSNQDYEIKDVPDWVNIYPLSGVLAPGQLQFITFEFDSSLINGQFIDTLVLDGNLADEPFPIHFRNLCRPPAWQIDPNSFDFSMNLTLELDIEGDLSKDEMDIVGAFVDGELRGMAYLDHLVAGSLDTFVVFLTVYSDNALGEEITFQIWDADLCLLYGDVLETFDFVADEIMGAPNDPVTLHTNNLLLREIPLHVGWNWISFNLEFPNPALNAALESLSHPNNDLMKSQIAFANYIGAPVNSWIGSLASLGNLSMYQYRADVPDTIKLLGHPIDVASTSIPIAQGWNWISYLPQYGLPVTEALTSLTPLNGDVIKNQTAFAQFVAGFGWLGNLEYLQAPEGYLLKMSNPGTLSYPDNFTGNPPVVQNRSNPASGGSSPWSVDPAQFEHTMILVGMLAENGENKTREGMTLGAFVNDEVRGVAPAIYLEQLDKWLFFLTIYANQPGELVTFKLHDAESDAIAELEETLFFAQDDQEGSVLEPMKFSLPVNSTGELFSAQSRLLVQPNPFNQSTLIRYEATAPGTVGLTITNALGKVVEQIEWDAAPGWNDYEWTAEGLPGGVYFLKAGTICRKVVVQR